MAQPTLQQVWIRASIYHLLLAHALSTEKEEIMGMLLGDWEDIEANGTSIAHVEYISLLTRSDKRKDRVEIAPEQLHLAAIHAEQMGSSTGKTTRVIGWYHSHPHITVVPSHVDIGTQESQQLMDSRFFGVIVSCFNTDVDHTNRIQITCFQANTEQNPSLYILPDSLLSPDTINTFTMVPQKVYEEQRKEFLASIGRIHYGRTPSSLSSGLPTSGAREVENEWMEVDIESKPASSSTRSLPAHLTRLHNASIYTCALTNLVDHLVGPSAQLLAARHERNLRLIQDLEARKRELLQGRGKSAKSKKIDSTIKTGRLVDI